MKTIETNGAMASTQPVTTTMALPLQEKIMATAERIQQLKPATNYVELMKLLRTIREQVLLLAPAFLWKTPTSSGCLVRWRLWKANQTGGATA